MKTLHYVYPLRYNPAMARAGTAEPKLSDATEKARAVIEGLHSRLKEAGLPAAPDDLERQLEAYFKSNAVSSLRERVIEAVVERILRDWDQVENEVVERLVERLVSRLGK
jgi:hypothetical protein